MELVALLTSAVLMIAMPIGLGIFLARRFKTPWRLFGLGALTFVASQVLHIPFNLLVQNVLGLFQLKSEAWSSLLPAAIFLGLSSGFFEEVARAVMYRTWARDARTWARGLMLGAGHGGIEAIFVGVLLAVNSVALWTFRDNPAALGVPQELLPEFEAQLAALFDQPLPLMFLGAAERAMAIIVHLSLSLMVMKMFVTGRRIWLLAAIMWHALLNATAVIVATRIGAVETEAFIAVFALVSLWFVWRWREPEPIVAAVAPLPPPDDATAVPAPSDGETEAQLEHSRYSD